MGCLFAVLAVLSPRLAVILLWLFTDLVDRAFTGFLLPLLGVAFLPFTTLMYVLAWRPVIGVTGGGWLWVVLGAILDVGVHGGLFARR
ncbi:MAG TPA: hypothetical protein VKG45_01660 [Actinomycetes bacterium]|nr:hypothetical protein [Actinomycetes bacterium]